MTYDKRGIAQSAVVSILIVLAFAVLVLPLTGVLTKVASAEQIIETCKLSVRAAGWQWQLNLLVMDLTVIDSPFGLNCRTLFTKLAKGSINTAGLKEELSKDSEERKSQLKDAVLKNMKDCWDMFGAGRVKVQQAVESKGTSCVVCSEFILDKDLKDENIVLDNMYAYAKDATFIVAEGEGGPNERIYLDYFLKGSVRPVGYTDKNIRLDKQYSVVFAVTTNENEKTFFGKDSIIKPDAGIVGCYVGGYDGPLTGDDAKDIGCNKDGEAPGLIFGKVLDGGTHAEFINFASTGLPGPAVFSRTYPLTVRMVPTSELPNYCVRLY